ncbi:MAG TPA: hypothetical protein VGM31_02915 [Puia sp.]|jgi:hypothetical protein
MDTVRFSYDVYGNPVTIVRQVTATTKPDYIFMYDKDHRLTDLKGVYSLPDPGGFDNWHRFHYKNGRIVSDTIYEFGITVNGMPAPQFPGTGIIFARDYATFQYDAQGRISVTVDSMANTYDEVSTYTYGKDGNLSKITTTVSDNGSGFSKDSVVTFATGYDHEVNINRTNPIWQFLDRDYSVNNRFIAGGYNGIGLPTLITAQNATSPFLLPLPFSFFGTFLPLTIQYSCDITGTENTYATEK